VPAHIGFERDDGYAIFRVAKILPLEARKDDQQKADRTSAERQAGSEQYTAYIEGLRARAKIEIISKGTLEKK
jgi:hypothetical protein